MFLRDTHYKTLIQSTRWRKLRNKYLQEHPQCELCGQLASEVHHREPLMKFRSNLQEMESMCFNPDNLIAVCHKCHIDLHKELGKYSHKKQDIKNLTKERVNRFNEEYFK